VVQTASAGKLTSWRRAKSKSRTPSGKLDPGALKATVKRRFHLHHPSTLLACPPPLPGRRTLTLSALAVALFGLTAAVQTAGLVVDLPCFHGHCYAADAVAWNAAIFCSGVR
jgi:hypothetical protein